MVWWILLNAFDRSRIISLSFSNQIYTLSNHCRFGESRLAPAGPEGRTINIEVHSVDICSDKRLWVYDFGGHETYHFSQQLFLSKQALYVITIDITTYKPTEFDTRLRHWYNMVTSRVVAPIICVVATHIDESESEDDVSAKCRDIEEKLKQLEYEVRNEKKVFKILVEVIPIEGLAGISSTKPSFGMTSTVFCSNFWYYRVQFHSQS